MSTLVLSSSLKEFFRLILGEVITRQKVSITDVTEFYVVNLLSEFAAVEKLFIEDGAGKKGEEPLALLYHKALSQDRDEKIRTLRRLGDVSLYTAGFFSQSLRDRPVGSDYYIQMGGNAYAQLAQLCSSNSIAMAYWELHEKFKNVVEVLEEIAARGQCATGPEGAMRVYESWEKTGNERLGTVLADFGLIPKGTLAN